MRDAQLPLSEFRDVRRWYVAPPASGAMEGRIVRLGYTKVGSNDVERAKTFCDPLLGRAQVLGGVLA